MKATWNAFHLTQKSVLSSTSCWRPELKIAVSLVLLGREYLGCSQRKHAKIGVYITIASMVDLTALDKALFSTKKVYLFLFLNENIYCGYSLEVPRRGASIEYPQHMFFFWEIRKLFTWHPLLSRLERPELKIAFSLVLLDRREPTVRPKKTS